MEPKFKVGDLVCHQYEPERMGIVIASEKLYDDCVVRILWTGESRTTMYTDSVIQFLDGARQL